VEERGTIEKGERDFVLKDKRSLAPAVDYVAKEAFLHQTTPPVTLPNCRG
jgi:hypothetical protein